MIRPTYGVFSQFVGGKHHAMSQHVALEHDELTNCQTHGNVALAAEAAASHDENRDILTPQLDAASTRILDFERNWRRHTASKEDGIVAHLQMSPTHYYMRLAALLDDPLALAHDPQLVARLRRLRQARQ